MKNQLSYKLKKTYSNVNYAKASQLIQWYDTYGGLIYGTILRFTDDRKIANEILMEIFITLKNKSFSEVSPVFINLLRFTYETSIKYLSSKQIQQNKSDTFSKTYPVLDCLLYKAYSLEEAEALLEIRQDKILKKLRDECLAIAKATH